MRTGGARGAAYRVLDSVEEGAYADRAAARHLEGLGGRDRRFAMELAYGCVRLRARLDAELARHCDPPLERLEPPVLLWLRLGLYQIREMRVPAHAAVNESVEGARRAAGRRAAGLVNAVLRSALRRGVPPDTFPDPERDPVGDLVVRGSHPEWLVRRWLARWPLARVRLLVDLDNRPPSVTLRLLGPSSSAEAAAELGPGFRLERLDPWPRACRLVEGEPGAAVARIAAVMQDPAASAVVEYAGRALEGPVLDVAGAPGTKALAAAWRDPSARPFVVADISRERLALARRAAAGPVGAGPGGDLLFAVMDGRHPALAVARTVLLDVPCTGTGVLRRRPDLRWRSGPDRLGSVVRLQRELLDAAAERTASGGAIVYSTCSLEPEENEGQVEAFLDRHPEFEREPGEPDGVPADAITPAGDLLVLPWVRETDGAYAAILRRGPVT